MNRAERRWRARHEMRYVLTCGICGRAFENESATLGDIERDHFARLHATTPGATLRFRLFDRRSGLSSVLN